jgi:hypothetical protein
MTSANLSYGCLVQYGFVFPWSNTHDDISSWWAEVNGFVNPAEFPYDEQDKYKEGFTYEHLTVWYDNLKVWLNTNPVPVKVINCGTGYYPRFILVAKTLSVHYGCEPLELCPESLYVSDEVRHRLVEFVRKYDIEAGKPKWWLSA